MGVEFNTVCSVSCDRCKRLYEIVESSFIYVQLRAHKDGWSVVMDGECLCPKCIEKEKPLKEKL